MLATLCVQETLAFFTIEEQLVHFNWFVVYG